MLQERQLRPNCFLPRAALRKSLAQLIAAVTGLGVMGACSTSLDDLKSGGETGGASDASFETASGATGGVVWATGGHSSSDSSSGGQGGTSGADASDAGSGGAASCHLPYGDDFSSGKLDPFWIVKFQTPGMDVAEVAGALRFTIGGGVPADAWVQVSSSQHYDLTDCGMILHVLTPPSAPGTYAVLAAWMSATERLEYLAGADGQLEARYYTGGVSTPVKKAIVDPALRAWWKLREEAGTIYWDASPDGKVWTAFASVASPFDITSLIPVIGVGANTSPSSTSEVRFDDFNLPP